MGGGEAQNRAIFNEGTQQFSPEMNQALNRFTARPGVAGAIDRHEQVGPAYQQMLERHGGPQQQQMQQQQMQQQQQMDPRQQRIQQYRANAQQQMRMQGRGPLSMQARGGLY